MASKIGAILFLIAGGVILGMMVDRVKKVQPDVGIMEGQPTGPGRAAVLYQHNCSVCHGQKGDGNGPAATVLDPRPRNFTLGKYRIVSSSNMVAYKEDIVRTLRNGLAGTSMPSWKHLGEEDISLLADYVIALWRVPAEAEYLKQPAIAKLKPEVQKTLIKNKFEPKGKVNPPAEPAVTQAGLETGKKLFLQNCALCHGTDGKGKQDPAWQTAEGFPIASRNFTSGIFKGGGRPQDLYTRIYSGIPGSPMPGFSSGNLDEIWHIVHYVQTLAKADPEPGEKKEASTGNSSSAVAEK